MKVASQFFEKFEKIRLAISIALERHFCANVIGRMVSSLSHRANAAIVALESFFNKIPIQKVKIKANATTRSRFFTLWELSTLDWCRRNPADFRLHTRADHARKSV